MRIKRKGFFQDLEGVDFTLNFRSVNYISGKMGEGKTLLLTLAIQEHLELYPNSKIYANYHLYLDKGKNIVLPNLVFTPLMLFPYDSLENCFIAIDDIKALSTAKGLITTIVNASRKDNITILITCQRFTQVHKDIREVCYYYDEFTQNSIKSRYYPSMDYIEIDCYNEYTVENILNKKYIETYCYYNVSRVFNMYNTNEKVYRLTERDMINEIVKFSNNRHDLDINLEICFSNRTIRERYYKKLVKEYDKFR